jgi:hypothetical protein
MQKVDAKRVAVRSSAWLGLCAWLIVVRALTVKCLAAALRTTLNIATKDVKLAFDNAAVMTRLAATCTPVLFLLAVANAPQDFAANPECHRNSVLRHRQLHRPNED